MCVTLCKSFYRNPFTETRRVKPSSAGLWIRPVRGCYALILIYYARINRNILFWLNEKKYLTNQVIRSPVCTVVSVVEMGEFTQMKA